MDRRKRTDAHTGLISNHIERLCSSIDKSVVRRRWNQAVKRVMMYGLTRERSVDLILRMLKHREKFTQDTELILRIVENWK